MERKVQGVGIGGWATLMLLTMLLGGSGGLARAEVSSIDETELGITVRVVNLANADRATVAYAEREAARILHEAGVEINWVDCAIDADTDEYSPGCGRSESPSELVVRIVSRFNGKSQHSFAPNMLGFSVVLEKPGYGTLAAVSYRRAMALTAKKHVAPHVVLGHAIAHEIGHLLLAKPEHAEHGLMRAGWNGTDLQRAALGHLNFSPEEAETIRAEVRERLLKSTSAPTAAMAVSR